MATKLYPADRPAVPETKSEDATSAEPIFSKLHHSIPCLKLRPLTSTISFLTSSVDSVSKLQTTLILVSYTSLSTHHSAQCTPVALLLGQRPQSSERALGLLHELIALCSGTHPQSAYSSRSVPYKPSRRHPTMRKTIHLLVSTPSRRTSICSSNRPSHSQNKASRNRTLLSPSPAQPLIQKHTHKTYRH